MRQTKVKRLNVLVYVLSGLLCPLAFAASVPAGVELAPEQQLIRANGSDPASLDPMMSETLESSNVLVDLFVGLVWNDAAGKVHPALAASWSEKNHQIWTFTSRADAKLSNGEPITA